MITNVPKRKYYNGVHYTINEANKTIELNPSFLKSLQSNNQWNRYKKLGGSTIGNILLPDRFKNDFKAFLHITRLSLPVLSKKYVNAGVALEPKIFDKLREINPQYKILNFEAANYNYDYFQGILTWIGGVPDGYIPETKTILEIKTAGETKESQWDTWGMDKSYKKQAQLYTYLMGIKEGKEIDNYSIIALFLKDNETLNDYLNPDKVNIDERTLRSYSFDVDKEELQKDIKILEEWYKKYTSSSVSPIYDETINKDELEYLKCSNEQEWIELFNKWQAEGKAD